MRQRRVPLGVTGGHAKHVAAATGSPQKADPLAAGRDFGLGPLADISQLRQKESSPRGRPLDSAHNQAFNPCHKSVMGAQARQAGGRFHLEEQVQ
jgi:hypothetical protein